MRQVKEKKLLVIIIMIMGSLMISISLGSATSVNSSNYTGVGFGVNVQTSTIESPSYEGESVSHYNPTTRNGDSEQYTVNVGFFENTTYSRTVSIQSYSVSPDSTTIGSTITISIAATNAQSAWAKITAPNGQTQTILLTNNEAVTFLPSPAIVGTYNVILYANSSTGSVASVSDSFTLTEQTAQNSTSNSGGTTVVIQSCTYNWDCSPWSICQNEVQTRSCQNIGTCTGLENKPSEILHCSEALFDVMINISKLNAAKSSLVKFGVSLIEQKGTEKIDVIIKYTIINNSGIEVFSQIETKAVEKELQYEKSLEELDLPNGKYTLRIDILYGYLQRAVAEQTFEVVDADQAAVTGKAVRGKLKIDLKNPLALALGVVMLLIAALVVNKLRHPPRGPHNRLRSTIGLKVYDTNGRRIGEVEETYISGSHSKVESWQIKLDRKIARQVGKRRILIGHAQIHSIKEIMILKESVSHHLAHYSKK